MTYGQNLKSFEKLTSFWIYHPEISLNAYFQLYNSGTWIDIEFQPHFPSI